MCRQHDRWFVLYFDLYNILMSRGNVFKLSSNNVLGGGSNYQNADIQEIKNSLKLLKAKKGQRQSSELPNNYGYGNVPSQPPRNIAAHNDYNYTDLSAKHLPGAQKQSGMDYSHKQSYNNQYKEIGQKRDYSNTDPYHQQRQPYPQSNSRNHRNQIRDPYPQSNSRNQQVRNGGNQIQDPYSQSNSRNQRGRNPGSSIHQPAKTSSYENNYDSYNPYEKYEPKKPNPKAGRTNNSRPQMTNNLPKYEEFNHLPTNSIEEKSIKQVNRQNRIDIVEHDPSEFKACRMGCGRKFNPESLAIHEKNCKKVFQKKRKEFNTQSHRLVDGEQVKLIKKGQRIEQKLQREKKNQKVPKWKSASLAFRAAMQQNRGAQMSKQDQQAMQAAEDEDRVQCRFCNRKFNEKTAAKHIKFCEQQARKNAMKRRK